MLEGKQLLLVAEDFIHFFRNRFFRLHFISGKVTGTARRKVIKACLQVFGILAGIVLTEFFFQAFFQKLIEEVTQPGIFTFVITSERINVVDEEQGQCLDFALPMKEFPFGFKMTLDSQTYHVLLIRSGIDVGGKFIAHMLGLPVGKFDIRFRNGRNCNACQGIAQQAQRFAFVEFVAVGHYVFFLLLVLDALDEMQGHTFLAVYGHHLHLFVF